MADNSTARPPPVAPPRPRRGPRDGAGRGARIGRDRSPDHEGRSSTPPRPSSRSSGATSRTSRTSSARSTAEAAVIAERYEVALGRWEQITVELRNTQHELHDAQDAFRALQGELDDRAREAYIVGPGNELEFLLGASSFTDLSARVEFVNALSQVDVDLATEVQNLKNELVGRAQGTEAAPGRRRRGAREGRELTGRGRGQARRGAESMLADLNAKEARAEELAKKLGRQYAARARGADRRLKFYANELFKVCPVGQPRALYDGFGAPRYGGGYHPHARQRHHLAAGDRAVRDLRRLRARVSTTALGGNSVHVYGAARLRVLRAPRPARVTRVPCQAGQVVGYVGSTGYAEHAAPALRVAPERDPERAGPRARTATRSSAATRNPSR